MSTKPIHAVIQNYLRSVKDSRSVNTFKTYENALQFYQEMLSDKRIDPTQADIHEISEETIGWMIQALRHHASTTERLYLTALTGFFEYLAAENLIPVNLPRVRLLIKQRARVPGVRLPQFPKDAIEAILDHMEGFTTSIPTDIDLPMRLQLMRDRAFIITLAETGLRVHEACNLRRGDIDWTEGRAVIIGKGNREAVVRFSRRSQIVLEEYLKLRAPLDGASGKPLGSLPVFARHDKGAGKKIKPMTTTTGRNIVADWVEQILGKDAAGTITPHSFRHYFVTRVLQGTGNLKMAQELARHRNIAVTQRYAHLSNDELDKAYWEVFEDES
jgi:integrase